MFSSKEGKPGMRRGWFKPQQESSPSSHRGPYTTHTHRQHSHNCTSASLGAGHSHVHTAATLEALKRQEGGACLAAMGSPTPAASVLDGDCPPSRQWRLSPTPPASVLPMRAGAQSLTPPRKGPIQPESATPRRDYADFLHEGVSHAHSHVEAHTSIRQAGAPPTHRG